MTNCFPWILLLILPKVLVMTKPLEGFLDSQRVYNKPLLESNTIRPENISSNNQIISIRVTSSVAVARGNIYKKKVYQRHRVANTPIHITNNLRPTDMEIPEKHYMPVSDIPSMASDVPSIATDIPNKVTEITQSSLVTEDYSLLEDTNRRITETHGTIGEGDNQEYIKQLNLRTTENIITELESVEPLEITTETNIHNETEDSVPESSNLSIIQIENDNNKQYNDFSEDIPLARSVSSQSAKNIVKDITDKRQDKGWVEKVTTVNFDIVHDTSTSISNYNNERISKDLPNPNLQNFYNSLPKVYSQPAQIYSEPAKFYSEPAKVYSEPAKVYSEPAKIYSEPAKIYSEPAKYYSEPASLHLPHDVTKMYPSWNQFSKDSTSSTTTPVTTITAEPTFNSSKTLDNINEENNYEVDEKLSVLTNGRAHGIQESTPENCRQENCKVGYVVEGRQFRKYRVEERTSDGFIVGEYGVVRNEDGALRGVRYTADSEASPRLIHDALMKFLQL